MNRNTDWFAQCGWGVFCHYLTTAETSAEEWNTQVDAFDVKGLAEQLRSCGASHFFITLGQGSGHYCAPNETYDRIAGIRPSKCARRDLISDLHGELHPLGIELMVYVPADGSFADREARKGLKMPVHWNDGPVDWEQASQWVQFRWVEYMRNWEAICRDWSLRWQHKVRGWWVDGCYHADMRYPEREEPNFRSFAAALRAGNRNALVAFNPGVLTPVICHTEHEDYTAGEVATALPVCPGPWVEEHGHRARYHVLSYLGENWCKAPPRFPDELVVGYTRHVTSKGGVVTWDVPIRKSGRIPEEFMEQLTILGKHGLGKA